MVRRRRPRRVRPVLRAEARQPVPCAARAATGRKRMDAVGRLTGVPAAPQIDVIPRFPGGHRAVSGAGRIRRTANQESNQKTPLFPRFGRFLGVFLGGETAYFWPYLFADKGLASKEYANPLRIHNMPPPDALFTAGPIE